MLDTQDYPIEGLPTPEPGYGPVDAIATQVEAFGGNDDPVENAGIKTAYNFASPGNRRMTGPLERFMRMVEGRRYSPMLDREEAVAGALERDGDRAEQRLTITGPDGRTVTSLFDVSKQESGRLEGCWLTDMVIVVCPVVSGEGVRRTGSRFVRIRCDCTVSTR
jgi:hypothetical protein